LELAASSESVASFIKQVGGVLLRHSDGASTTTTDAIPAAVIFPVRRVSVKQQSK